MKKTAIIAFACVLFGIYGTLNAQNCDEILAPYYQFNNIDPDIYPAEKADYRCQFSRNAFYLCDNIPDDAIVHEFSDLILYATGEHAKANTVVDLEHLSYYTYNFESFLAPKATVYFRLKNGKHKFLALRGYIPINKLIEAADKTE